MDGLLGYIKKYGTSDILTHHFCCLVVCGYVLITGKNGYMLLNLFFWGEVTNPIIGFAEILEDYGVADFYFVLFPTIVAFQSYEWIWMMLNKLVKLGSSVNSLFILNLF